METDEPPDTIFPAYNLCRESLHDPRLFLAGNTQTVDQITGEKGGVTIDPDNKITPFHRNELSARADVTEDCRLVVNHTIGVDMDDVFGEHIRQGLHVEGDQSRLPPRLQLADFHFVLGAAGQGHRGGPLKHQSRRAPRLRIPGQNLRIKSL